MPDQSNDNEPKQPLLGKLINQTTLPVIAALFSQLNTQRPRHSRVAILSGLVGSQLSYADDYIHFTLNISPNRRAVWRRHVRCKAIHIMAHCPDLQPGDFVELIGYAYAGKNATEAVYIHRYHMDSERTPLELFTDILEILLAVQSGANNEGAG